MVYAALNPGMDGVRSKFLMNCQVTSVPVAEAEAALAKELWELLNENMMTIWQTKNFVFYFIL